MTELWSASLNLLLPSSGLQMTFTRQKTFCCRPRLDFNFHGKFGMMYICESLPCVSGPVGVNNRCNRSTESRIFHGRAQNFYRWVSLPRILFPCQLLGGGAGEEELSEKVNQLLSLRE